MFRYPIKFSQYSDDVVKSIDYILKMLRKPKVDKIIAGTNVSISPASGTGDVTLSVAPGGFTGVININTTPPIAITVSGGIITNVV